MRGLGCFGTVWGLDSEILDLLLTHEDGTAFIRSYHDDGLSPTINERISLFSSIGNAWSGGPFIKSAHHLHELASQQDERAPQYEGDAIE